MKKTKRNLILAGLAIAMLLCIAFSAFPAYRSATTAYAVNNDNAFDNTELLDDFKDENGNFIADFNYSDYPFKHLDTENKFFVMNFMEYCYSYKTNLQDHYGLYLYVYNPNGYELIEDSEANKVQMAVSWRTETQDGQTVTVADDYEKFGLKYCSKSVYKEEEGALYKFRIIDHVSEHDRGRYVYLYGLYVGLRSFGRGEHTRMQSDRVGNSAFESGKHSVPRRRQQFR